MNLGELITALEKLPKDLVFKWGLSNPRSYTGFYSDIAFDQVEDVSVSDMLKMARGCLGKTFEGVKGGFFVMEKHTDCWVMQDDYKGEALSQSWFDYQISELRRGTESLNVLELVSLLQRAEEAIEGQIGHFKDRGEKSCLLCEIKRAIKSAGRKHL